MTPAQDLLSAAQPLLERCSTWTPRSWRHRAGWPASPADVTPAGRTEGASEEVEARTPPGADGAGSRADVTFAVVAALADLAADAEGRARRPVPRLDDLALVDQLSVMLHDIAGTADAPACRRARDIVLRLGDAIRA